MLDKKKQIMVWLRRLKRMPTNKIMALIGTNLEYAKKYLGELESEGKIEREEETNATYWMLKK